MDVPGTNNSWESIKNNRNKKKCRKYPKKKTDMVQQMLKRGLTKKALKWIPRNGGREDDLGRREAKK